VGVADTNWEQAKTIAAKHGTRPLNRATLLKAVDAVSVVVPTQYHASVVREAFDADTHVLAEKPFVDDPAEGREPLALAAEKDLRLQVGHIERFNPAVRAPMDVLPEMDVLAVDARRLGPPVDRENTDSVVNDLMIHDLDVMLSLFDTEVDQVFAAGIRGEPHATATLQLNNGVLGTLTASRITHQKIRKLEVTGRDCRVTVDYLTQSVRIHRHSLPEYIESDGDVRYRSESVVERPQVNNGEPLQEEPGVVRLGGEHGNDAGSHRARRASGPRTDSQDKRRDRRPGGGHRRWGCTMTAQSPVTETTALYGSEAPSDQQRQAFREGSVPVAVYGMGKIGLPLSLVYAAVTGSVTGVDIDQQRVAALNDGTNPSITSRGYRRCCRNTSKTGVSRRRPTAKPPPRMHGSTCSSSRPSLTSPTTPTCRCSVPLSTPSARVSIRATWCSSNRPFPGACEDVVAPRLTAGDRVLGEFGLAHCPERTASGHALQDIRGSYPKIVGGIDAESGRVAGSSTESHE